jgi:hypothetical protein
VTQAVSLYPLTEDHYFALHGRPTTAALIENAREWLRRTNVLLDFAIEAGIELAVDQLSGNHIASGHRPAGVNARTANAAVASTHLTCEGGDIQDNLSRSLMIYLVANEELLERIGMWMEDPRWTAGTNRGDPWCHLQTKPPRSGNRIYIPSDKPAGDPHFYERAGLLIPSYLK